MHTFNFWYKIAISRPLWPQINNKFMNSITFCSRPQWWRATSPSWEISPLGLKLSKSSTQSSSVNSTSFRTPLPTRWKQFSAHLKDLLLFPFYREKISWSRLFCKSFQIDNEQHLYLLEIIAKDVFKLLSLAKVLKLVKFSCLCSVIVYRMITRWMPKGPDWSG